MADSSAHAPLRATPVTAVVPCFNAAPWLRQCLESILGQTDPVAEIIVVDDGSTDASAAIAAEYPVRLLRLGTNHGASSARNTGLRAASHEILAWLDADDYWDPQHCETVVPLLVHYSDAALAFARVRFEQRPERPPWGMPTPCPGPEFLVWESLHRCVVPMTAAVTRRGPCVEAGGFRDGIAGVEDFDLWLRLSLAHPFVWTPAVTAAYRWRLSPTQASFDVVRAHTTLWRSRMLIWEEVRATGDAALAVEMLAHLQDIWADGLVSLWRQRKLTELGALLNLPDASPLDTPFAGRLRTFLSDTRLAHGLKQA